MLMGTTHPAACKVVAETFSPIVQVLDETLHQIASGRVADVVLQPQRSARGRILVSPIRAQWTPAITVNQALNEQLPCQDVTRAREMESQKEPPDGFHHVPPIQKITG